MTDNSKDTQKQTNWRFSFWVAKRYLFSKKSHNAINIISGISAAGVCIGTATLICVLSVFNGFESLIQNMFSAFDPDLKISLVEGKTFASNTPEFEQVKKLESVVSFAEVVEETALLRFNDRQMPAIVYGVSNGFSQVTHIDSIMYDGSFLLNDGAFDRAIVGIGLANKLGINAHLIDPLAIYAPKRTGKINLIRPETSFNQASTFMSGVFVVNQPEYDDQYAIIPIHLARQIFEYEDNTVSNIQLNIKDDTNAKRTKSDIRKILGKDFKVQDKYEQQEDFFNITRIEKWITYLILCFILLIATFNIIGSLSMLILEKKEDIGILRSLGAEEKLIKKIFLMEGWMISALGAVIGLILSIAIVLVQQHFGILKLGGENYVVEAYPVVLSFTDILISFVSVLAMGFLAAIYPVRYISSADNKYQKGQP
ncbi:MAG: FtsX-like permease family protein [Paludibacteraceae bacterium]